MHKGGDANTIDGPYADGGGEADLMHHCDRVNKCARAMPTKFGLVGVCFHNDLTEAGVQYTIEALEAYVEAEGASPEVLDLWADELRDYTLCKSHEDVLYAYDKTRDGEIKYNRRAPRKKQDTKVDSLMAFFDSRPAVSDAIYCKSCKDTGVIVLFNRSVECTDCSISLKNVSLEEMDIPF